MKADIRARVKAFRRALELAGEPVPAVWRDCLNDFPEGCCELASQTLDHIMRNGVPLLELRAAQLPGITHIPHGTSLAFALFIEAARRDLPTLIRVHKELFFLQKEGDFLDMVDQILQALRLPPTERPVF